MYKKKIFLACLLFSRLAFAKDVVFLGSIHGDHGRFPLYNFETLKIALEHLSPDILLIEEDPDEFSRKTYETQTEAEYMKTRPIEIKTVVMPYAKEKNVRVFAIDERKEYTPAIRAAEMTVEKSLKNKDQYQEAEAIFRSYESLFLGDYLTKSIYDFHSESTFSVIEQHIELQRRSSVFKDYASIQDKRQSRINENMRRVLTREKYSRAVVVFGLSHLPSMIRSAKELKNISVTELNQALRPKIPSYWDRRRLLTLPQ